MTFTYKITSRSAEIGGGWRLHLIENGTDVGGGVFLPDLRTAKGAPPLQCAGDDDSFAEAFADAEAEAKLWLREHKYLTTKLFAKSYEIEATRSGWRGRLYKHGDVHAVLLGGPIVMKSYSTRRANFAILNEVQ